MTIRIPNAPVTYAGAEKPAEKGMMAAERISRILRNLNRFWLKTLFAVVIGDLILKTFNRDIFVRVSR